MSKYDDLVKKLREIFQIDKPDLDFGIYRIINQRAEQIDDYLKNTLRQKVETEIGKRQNADTDSKRADLIAQIRDEFGKRAFDDAGNLIDDAASSELGKALAALDAGVTSNAEHENAVFSHLLTFFPRYYHQADFISQRRYKGDTYAIPYSGEEVMLHWANKDQYYIKSGENFSNYTFKLDDGRKVHFHLVSADTAKDNRKDNDKTRRFALVEAKSVTRTDDDGEEFEETIVPIEESEVTEAGDTTTELVLRFEYIPVDKKTKQEALNTAAIKRISDDATVKARWLDLSRRKPTEKNPQRTVLEKNLTDYTSKNSSDYFIHKNLEGFLRNELDFYIKNEVLQLDDVQEAEKFADIEKNLRMIQCFRSIGQELISFLAQIENFQKKLWLKKKFVVETNYCITLDRVPEELYPNIVANDAQREEWVKLFAIHKIKGEELGEVAYTEPLSVDFLKANDKLLVDSKLFSDSFKYQLLYSIQKLDEECDGLLIHSENSQALSLIPTTYRGEIKCIYIDPPYNTGHDGFIYKDNFKSSTWMSMIQDRLSSSKTLLKESGTVYCSINKIERDCLLSALDGVYGKNNRIEELIWVQDTVSNNAPAYSTNHEYIEVFAKNRARVESEPLMFRETRPGYKEVMEIVDEIAPDFPETTEIESRIKALYKKHKEEHIADCMDSGMPKKEAEKTDIWKGIYPYSNVEYRDKKGALIAQEKAKSFNAKPRVWRKVEPSMPSGKQADSTKDHNSENFRFYEPPHPITKLPCKAPKRGWAFPYETIGNRPSYKKYVADHRIWFPGDSSSIPQQKYFLHEVGSVVSSSVIRQYADGEPKLEQLFGEKGLISNPKPPALIGKIARQTTQEGEFVLDFFAGSGTTGSALIDEQRLHGIRRKYMLIESGDHFETVLIPRIKKSCYSSEWSSGEPQCRLTGISQCFKYIRLESYEDTLNNLQLKRNDAEGLFTDELKDDYLLNYMLDVESQGSLLSVEDFKKPFDYTLKIAADSAGAFTTQKVDMVETFNYLIGLRVKHIDAQFERGYVTVEGTLPSEERCLVLWRDCDQVDYDSLNKLCEKLQINPKDTEYDVVYINGDHNIPSITQEAEDEGGISRSLKLRQIEPEFLKRMFEVEDV